MRATLILLLCVACTSKQVPVQSAPPPVVKIVVEAMLGNPTIRAAKFASEGVSGVFFLDTTYEISGEAHGADYKIWPMKNLFFYNILYHFQFSKMEFADNVITAEYRTMKQDPELKRQDISGVIILHLVGGRWNVIKHELNGE